MASHCGPQQRVRCSTWLQVIAISSCIIITLSVHLRANAANSGGHWEQADRKSLVFDVKTPKVFYCPQEKQSNANKIIVKAKPLDKLCEYGGEPRPKGAPSDCFNDLDETEFACDEKKRFMIKLDLISEVDQMDDLDLVTAKGSVNKKKFKEAKKAPHSHEAN